MNYTNVYVPSTLDGYGGKLRSGYGEEVVDADYLASGAKTRAYKSPITHSRLIDSGTKDSYFYGDRIIDYNSIKITRNLLLGIILFNRLFFHLY